MRSLLALILLMAPAWAQSVFPPASGGGGSYTPGTGIAIAAGEISVDTTTTPQFVTSISAASGSCVVGGLWLRTTTGDLSVCTNADTWTLYVPATRQITASGPLAGGGDMSTDRTLSCPTCEVTGNKGSPSGYASLDSSGQVPEAQMPALSGDVTSEAGSTTITVTKLQGRTVATTAPTIGQALTYDGSQWAPGSPVQAVDLTVMRRDEAFCTGDTASGRIGSLGWFLTNATGTGTVTGPTSVTPVAGYPCAIRLNTAAQASASSGINASAPAQIGGAIYGGSGITWEWQAIIVPGANSTTLTGARIRVGYLTAIPTDFPATGGIFWRYDASHSDAAWKFQVCKSTTGCSAASTGTDTTVLTFTAAPSAGTRVHLRARRTSTQICASVDNEAEQCTDTTNMPTANSLMFAINGARTSAESTAFSIEPQRWSEIISGLTTY